ncbi:hypothetical protein AX767_09660 [Variovorax sp. PAMC 28711]|nr:hypothetical protein AX767_09660 [Variovorax sp. PAMC 28711]
MPICFVDALGQEGFRDALLINPQYSTFTATMSMTAIARTFLFWNVGPRVRRWIYTTCAIADWSQEPKFRMLDLLSLKRFKFGRELPLKLQILRAVKSLCNQLSYVIARGGDGRMAGVALGFGEAP